MNELPATCKHVFGEVFCARCGVSRDEALGIANARIAELEAERDALRYCGNCKCLCLSSRLYSAGNYDCASEDGTTVMISDHCCFTPSRWQPRDGGEVCRCDVERPA